MFPKALKTLQILSPSDSPGPTLFPNIRVGSPLPAHTNRLIKMQRRPPKKILVQTAEKIEDRNTR